MLILDTSRGARIALSGAPEELGPGVMLILGLTDPRDSRRAEVFMSPMEWAQFQHLVCGKVS